VRRRWRRRRKSVALLSQTTYTERPIPSVVEKQTLLPSSDTGDTQTHGHIDAGSGPLVRKKIALNSLVRK
jgi:hypothetical protein